MSKGRKAPKVKVKTHRGAAKRFKVTGSGKILRKKIGKGHLLEKKSSKRKRHLNKKVALSSTHRKKIKRLIGL